MNTNTEEIFAKLHDIAADPAKQKDQYLAAGKKVVLTAPVYTPEEIIHAMGMVPMGAWGANLQLNEAKTYFPAFICSIVQSILELGKKGAYDGVTAIVIPSLCDSLKVLGENWKYAVPSIPFIPMTYPQNRKPSYGKEYAKAGYERVIADLEKMSGRKFEDTKLAESIQIYNEHNDVMREFARTVPLYPEVTAVQRSEVFKSAFFMLKEEHTALVKALLEGLKAEEKSKSKGAGCGKIKIMTTGILADAPELLQILDENDLIIAADDVAAESRQYRTDTVLPACSPASESENEGNPSYLDALADKFCAMDYCSVLYDPQKKRVPMIVDETKAAGAKGVVVVLTKFCDPEEFDYPLLKKACEAEGIPCILIEVDRQMEHYEQAKTMVQTFRDML